MLVDFNSTSVYFTNGLNSLAYIRLNIGNLLLLDLNDNTNRKLIELFSFTYEIANPFSLKLIHNDSALEYNIDDALVSVGYAGTIPIVSLESRFMKLYTTGAGNDYIT